jgi:hypothetical protein
LVLVKKEAVEVRTASKIVKANIDITKSKKNKSARLVKSRPSCRRMVSLKFKESS